MSVFISTGRGQHAAEVVRRQRHSECSPLESRCATRVVRSSGRRFSSWPIRPDLPGSRSARSQGSSRQACRLYAGRQSLTANLGTQVFAARPPTIAPPATRPHHHPVTIEMHHVERLPPHPPPPSPPPAKRRTRADGAPSGPLRPGPPPVAPATAGPPSDTPHPTSRPGARWPSAPAAARPAPPPSARYQRPAGSARSRPAAAPPPGAIPHQLPRQPQKPRHIRAE